MAKKIRVLIVDDSSPDGTGEIADRLAAESHAVEVLHRSEREGLGPAYLAGFRRAISAGADLILEMDADFSHDPADIGRLVAAIDGAADGRDKLAGLAPGLPLVACLTGTELGQAFGREHEVHAALRPGRLAEAFVGEAKRLAGFRAGATVKDETDLSDGTGLR